MKTFLFSLVALAFFLVCLLIGAPAKAANCSGYTYTLTNGQTADATQVMSNFNSILSCANNSLAKNGANSDITSISALITPLSAAQGGTGTTSIANLEALLQPYLPFDFYTFVGGLTGNAWNLAAYQPSTSVVLTTAASACKVGTAATGTTTYTLKDNGASIGTAVVTAGTTTCVATITASPYSVTAGHALTLVGPATGDATLADIGMTFGGTRN